MTPGEHLRAEIQRLGLDQGAVANEIDVSRQTINNIVNDRQPISRSMAAKLGRVTGHSSDYWLRASFPDAPLSQDPGDDSTVHRPLFTTVLVNHQIVAAVRDGIIGIDPFFPENVQRASIDLTLDDFIITAEDLRADITSSNDQGFQLHSRQTVNVKTREWLEFPLDYIGRVGPMTGLAKFGIIVSHGLQVDPGYKGYLQFCLFNAGASTFVLRSGSPIISLEIIPLAATPRIDPSLPQPFDAAAQRDDVRAHFRAGFNSDVCNQAIRDFIRRQVSTTMSGSLFSARIAQLDIDMCDKSEQAAIASAVAATLDGLRTLRNSPGVRTLQSDRFKGFVGELAEQVRLSRQDCLSALIVLGLVFEGKDGTIVTLRNGDRALVHLPKGEARISLKALALQLQEPIDEMTLSLTGQIMADRAKAAADKTRQQPDYPVT